jgi:transposase
LHILLLLAQHRSPSEIAEWLWCSRSSVYEVATRWRQGWRPEQETPEADTSLALAPSLRRRLLALLRKPPIVEGWCRTRWSGATLALSLQARRGLKVSAETVRRWLHPLGWSWKRTKLIAPDNDPERAVKLARIRLVAETLRPRQALLFADEWALALLPKSGYQGMPKGTPVEGMTPGKNEKHYAAGAWNFRTGTVHYRFGPGKTNPLFRDLLDSLAVIRLVTRTESMWSWTITKSTKRRLSGAGWQRIPASSCSGCRPIVPGPTRSNASLATRMTR